MSNFNYEGNPTKLNFDMASTNVLIDFFKDKNVKCLSRLNEIKAGLILRNMQLCFATAQESRYRELAREFYQMPDYCISSACLGHTLIKLKYRTYVGLALYSKLKAFLSRK